MKTRQDLLAHLTALNCAISTTEHPALFTVAESEEWHHKIPGAHSKNLFVKDKKSRLFLIVARHDAPLELKQVHNAIGGSGRVSFCNAETLWEKLGVKPGSVTPFSAINDSDGVVTVVLEKALIDQPVLNFHPLENTATTTISNADLLRFLTSVNHAPVIAELPLVTGESTVE